ncbi:MAG TPA: flagellar motor protein [Bryobacteraceae bacterium]|jgi:chemotaxis protein MotA|nr:flagellar motor protein [Bryobacteraceae bacterium]
MAETPEPKNKKAPKEGPKREPLKPDLATFAGFALALGGIVGGLLLEKGSIQDVAQGTAAMIVFGGTVGAVLVTTPLPVFIRALKRLGSVLFEQANSTTTTIEALIQYATKARKNGIVSLEAEAASITDPFMRKALSLAVDGTDLQEIRKMMEIDINVTEQGSEAEAKVWDAAGGYAPTVGIIGAVMGLIQVMKHLEDIKEVGHGIAVAFVATVYGVASSNLFFLPAANKMRARMHNASALKEMTLEGVMGIVEGLNPTLIRMKLAAFDAHPDKPKKVKSPKGAKGAEPASKTGAPAGAPAAPASAGT